MPHGVIAPDKVRICLIIPKELKEQLEQISAEQNRSRSNYIVTVLLDAVNNSAYKGQV